MPLKDEVARKTYHAEYWRKYYAANKDTENKRRLADYYRWRRELIDAYGGRCACCGEDRIPFLALDHSFRDGAADRKRMGGMRQLMHEIRRLGYPTDRGYRILCANCN